MTTHSKSPLWSPTILAAFVWAWVLTPGAVWAADPDGAALFTARCATCHDNSADGHIPRRSELAALTPENILSAMVSGVMTLQAAGLREDEERAIARYVSRKEFSSGGTTGVGQCPPPARALSVSAADWNGWGVDSDNSRYQPSPGLAASEVARLKLKWAFGYPAASTAPAQPTVVGGRLFVGSAAGNVYSLDAATGCTYWTYKAGAVVRSALTIARSRTSNRYVAYFGDSRAFVHAVDAETGAPLWKVKIEDHPAGHITGAAAFHEGRVYVPVASGEEVFARRPTYECCTFRGSVVALDAETGQQIWKGYAMSDPPKAYGKSKEGTQLYGPAGAGIWSAPTVDAKRKLVYATTGDSYSGVDSNGSDAIVAFDLDTGRLVWVRQVLAKDNWINGCPGAPNCPDPVGPDFDFASGPILRTIGGQKQILIAAQKSGVVWGLDPDKKGEIVWQTSVGAGTVLGGVQWGHAADDRYTYAAVSDLNARPGTSNSPADQTFPFPEFVQQGAQPGISALRLDTGQKVWTTPAPSVACPEIPVCRAAQSAAVSVIPGVVFSGAMNGHFRAYATGNGEIIWDVDTAHAFVTVNAVAAKGGSINGGGPAIANGMVFTNSGYSLFGGAAGGVLLAFSVDGK